MKENSLTERELASQLGISQQHLNYIARGVKKISLDLARRIIKVTNGKVNIADLFEPKSSLRMLIEESERK